MLEKITLEGRYVRLEPIGQHHLDGLCEAVMDGELWNLAVTSVPHPKEMQSFINDAEAAYLAGVELPFVIVETEPGKVVGSTRFLEITKPHKRVEIGFTFVSRSRQRTPVNTEAKLLLLSHAFNVWNFNRVQFCTDVRNERSRNAILRLGAKLEGVLRSHMVMRDGYVRDSLQFSITKDEWQEVEAGLRAKLNKGQAG